MSAARARRDRVRPGLRLRLGAGPLRVDVGAATAADATVVRDFFRGFGPPPRRPTGRVDYDIDDRGRVRRDGRSLGRAPDRADDAPPVPIDSPLARARAIALDVGDVLPRRAGSSLVLHAGALARRGRAMLLPAPAKGGKSTLVLGMLARGWSYLSDDLAIVGRSGGVEAFPRPIDLRPGALDLLGDPGPAARDLRIYATAPRGRGGPGGRVAVRVSRRRVARRPARVRWVVFPHVRLRRPTVVRALGPAEAAVRLARMACNLDALRAPGFERLTRLLAGADAFSLEVGRLRDGLAALSEISGAAHLASRTSYR